MLRGELRGGLEELRESSGKLFIHKKLPINRLCSRFVNIAVGYCVNSALFNKNVQRNAKLSAGPLCARLRGYLLHFVFECLFFVYCRLDFSYFRNLPLGFFVSLYSCIFIVAFCIFCKLLQTVWLLEWGPRTRQLPRTGHGCSSPGPPL